MSPNFNIKEIILWIKSELKDYLTKTLTELNLNKQELTDFLAYWLPIVNKEQSEYLFITFLFNDQVKQLSTASNATLATNEFAANVKAASQSVTLLGTSYKESADAFKTSSESLNYSVETLQDTYSKAAQKVEQTNTSFVQAYEKISGSMDVDFSALKTGNKQNSENIGSLNKNLGAINAIFELQLQEVDFDKMISELKGSVAHSQKYSQEITKLGKRLEALNTVYGNMLTAMNVKVD